MIEYLPLVLTGIGIIVSILYYTNTLRNQNMTRQTQLFMQFNSKLDALINNGTWYKINNEWSWTDYNDFMQKYGPDSNPDKWITFLSVFRLFEQLGVLAKHGSISAELMFDLIASGPVYLFDKYEEIIDGYRREKEVPPKGQFMEYFEDLTNTLRDLKVRDVKDFEKRIQRRKTLREKHGKTMPDYNR
jgi:hypothetical protein